MKIPSEGIDSTIASDKKVLEELVLKKFPKKALELTDLLSKDEFGSDFDVFDELNISNIPNHVYDETSEDVSQDKRRRLDDCTDDNGPEDNCLIGDDSEKQIIVHSNRHLVSLMDLLRPVMDEFVEDVLKVNIGATLMVPQIEDGNNFGVEVQEDTIDVIETAYKDIYSRITEFHKFCSSRALLVKDVLKYPKVEDCRRAVYEKDQTFHRFLRLCLILVRNHYLILNDVIEKNLTKIKKPKSSAKSNMY